MRQPEVTVRRSPIGEILEIDLALVEADGYRTGITLAGSPEMAQNDPEKWQAFGVLKREFGKMDEQHKAREVDLMKAELAELKAKP